MTDGPRGCSSKTLLLSLISTLPLILPAMAHAQQAPASPRPTQQADSGTQVGELVVTAEKREERLINVPASISVQTSQDIKNEHLIAISDLSQEVPNVLMSGSSLFPSVTIRGVGSSSGGNPGFAPGATMYVDEVYQGRERAENIPLCGVSQIEVLRGPQSTLYGKNTIAGAINVTTEAPTNTFHASGDVQFGNLDFSQVCATVSGPVVDDKLLVSISGINRHRDGDILNAFNGKRLNYDNADGIRGRAIWNASSRLSVDFSADFLHEHDTESDLTTDYSVFQLLPPPYSTAPTFNPDTRTESLNAPETGARDVWGASARINYDMDGVKLTSITAARGYATFYQYDSDGTALNEDAQNTLDDAHQFSQELRLTSTAAGPFQWIVGGYYYNESLHDVFQTNFFDQFPTLILGLPPLPTGYHDLTVATANVVENSYAAFASANYSFTDKLVLQAGIRYTQDNKEMHFSQLTVSTTPVGALSIGSLLLSQIPPRIDTISEGVPTFDASLSYKFTPNEVAYIKVSRGYKAGGFNAFVITPPFNPALSLGFKPEFLNNYEVGFKGEWFENRVTLDSAFFYDDYTNKQEIVENVALLGFTVENAAKARVYGAELEGAVRPLPGLEFSADLGLLNGKYTSFPNGGVGLNFTGDKLAGAPDWDGTFAAQYQHEVSNGISGLGRIEVFHTDSFFEDPNNTPGFETMPYTYLNGRLGIQSDDGRWGLYLWGRNLTNQLVFSGGYAAIPLTARAVNFPRTFGIELSVKQ